MLRGPLVWFSTRVRQPLARGLDVMKRPGKAIVLSAVSYPPPVAARPAGQMASMAVSSLIGTATTSDCTVTQSSRVALDAAK